MRKRTLLKLILWVTVALLLVILLDYLPLHDISNDYVSQKALDQLGLSVSAPLPDWTETAMEWDLLTASYFLKAGLAAVDAVLILLLHYKVRKQNY